MKILIVGIVASGKTTLAKRLSKEENISHYEIDSIVHDDLNKRKRSGEEQLNIINDINKNNDWIIEGTLRKNLDILLDFADKIIFIDIDKKIRKRRIISRYIKQKLRIEKCNYKPSLEMVKDMFKWTNDFEKEKNNFLKRIYKYEDKLIVLSSVNEINKYKL